MAKDYILVVDDNYGIRCLLLEFLTQEGFDVKEASNGFKALQLVIEEKPKLVLLDMRMPGLSGMQTLAKLKDLAPGTIVVIMSAYFDAKDLKVAVEEGQIEHFVVKPFDLEEIRTLIGSLMNNLDSFQSIIS